MFARTIYSQERKGPLRFRPFPKEKGAAFTAISSTEQKAAVRKVINMMNFSLLSSQAWSHITRSSVSWKQNHCSDTGLSYRITYPNRYGVSIIKHVHSYGWRDDLWELAVLKDDEICYDTCITEDVCGYLTEEEVIGICDNVFGL